MNVNLSSRELLDSYNRILSGDDSINWTIFTYAQGSNDLKVQANGDGGLEEVADEFRDGRMQYAFVRVTDPNSELPKFVQINWCGDGVPESKKGLFHSHSATVAAFLKASHIQINARNEEDVDPAHILKRLADSGGSKYSVQQKQQPAPTPRDKIAPVGSAYTPTGKIDMGALRAGKPAASSVSTPTPSAFNRPTPAPASTGVPRIFGAPAPVKQPAASAPPPVKATLPQAAPDDDETWGDEPPVVPKPNATATPAPAPKSSAPATAGSFYRAPPPAAVPAKVEVKQEAEKPKEDDRIAKVGTAYTPVSLPKPKKLVNPFAAAQASTSSASPASTPSSAIGAGAPSSSGKLTWSQRQALAKERDAVEEAKSQAASASSMPSSAGKASGPLGGVSAAAIGAGVGVALAGVDHGETTSDKEEDETETAAPPPPPFASRPLPPRAPVVPADDDDEGFDEPAPAPPPARSAIVPNAAPAFPSDDEDGFDEPAPAPPPVRSSIVANAPPQFPDDDEDFDEPADVPPPKRTAIVPNAAPSFPSDDDFAEDDDVPPPPPPPPAARARSPSPEPAVATSPSATPAATGASAGGGLKARVVYAYDKTEDNEVDLEEGEIVTDIDQIDDGWWAVTNSKGESGLVPANYMELLTEDEEAAAATPAASAPPPRPASPELEPEPETTPTAPASGGKIAIALYDYDAGEDNEISFREGERITEIEEASPDWWEGTSPDGQRGLFPSAYVSTDEQ